MDIGPPVRIIEIEPFVLPVPEAFPMPEIEPERRPANPTPDPEAVPA